MFNTTHGRPEEQKHGERAPRQGYLIAHGLRQRRGDVEHLPHARWKSGLCSSRPGLSRAVEPFSAGICGFRW